MSPPSTGLKSDPAESRIPRWRQPLLFIIVAGVTALLSRTTLEWLPPAAQSAILAATSPTDELVGQAGTSVSPEKRASGRQSQPGQLRDIGNDILESPAGLRYLPGSADGHRLKHVLKHAADEPAKKIHGVFDGDRRTILTVIDDAWIKSAKGGPDVRRQSQNDREVVTVNLKRRIGYVGGQEGRRKQYPECRYLRLVLENKREVVTAYPTLSF
jgi:hypothetical protein